jgi:hypothetical protein
MTVRKIPAPKVAARFDPIPEEITNTSLDGNVIVKFLRTLAPFFETARHLEANAVSSLTLAKAMKRPTTMQEDESCQRFLKQVNADSKAVESHWNVTTIVFAFHRRLVAARKRATDPLDEAKTIANGHHNAYVETEKRRVAIEQERLRREAEERARIDRERELAEAEEQALMQELELENCSDRERNFVSFYVLPIYTTVGNAAAAAERAGYKNPDKAAVKLMSTPKIEKAIEAQRAAEAIRAQNAAVRQQPLNVDVETVKPRISRSAGGHERTTWTGEILDEPAFIAAFLAGKHGIPADVVQINPVKLNEYARSLGTRLDLWPGVRAKKSTTFV